ILQYPWGARGAVSIQGEDLDHLKPGIYLNDVLIEFGLRYMQDQLGQDKAAIRKDIFVFSSFWFPRFKRCVLKHSHRKYEDIWHWTSKINIFAMRYLIILIHKE
ncbi:hypothetical protein F5146DRAFT_876183, partial [Armillaria mellea]